MMNTIITERNRYFTGKFMTARDFASEQAYFLDRHRLHNRLFHGQGIVAGLEVVHHHREDCRQSHVIVHPGVALDCCGRELFVHEPQAVQIPLPPPDENGDYEPFLLCAKYDEEPIERVPALYSEDACDLDRLEANRVRELVRLEAVALREIRRESPDCWPAPGAEANPSYMARRDCDQTQSKANPERLSGDCVCGHRVPLALVRYRRDPKKGLIIDQRGRRNLPSPGNQLTRIVYTNWTHGGSMRRSELIEKGGRLEVLFDRPILQPADEANTGTSINSFTFQVRFGGAHPTLHFVESVRVELETIEGERDPRLAVFEIAPWLLEPLETSYEHGHPSLVGHSVYVAVKCDFLLDCHGNAVDGTHLRGQLPTGNGTPGGTFESWFTVLPDAVSAESGDARPTY